MKHPMHAAKHRAQRTVAAYLAIPVAVAALVTVACRDITSLKQENLGQLSGETVFIPANAQLIVNGAIGDFQCAFSRYALGSGIFTDELANALSANGAFDYDRRTLATSAGYGTATCSANNTLPGVYTPLSVARAAADTAVAKLEGWTDAEVPNRQKLIGQAAAYAGYSLVLLGEGMCSAAINLGPEMTPAQLFAEAKLRFDKAVTSATAAGDTTTLNFARLGRARTQLDLGNKAAAAADAALIPSGFVVNISTDATNARRQNAVWSSTVQGGYSSVDTSFQNIYNTTQDPRVAYTSTGKIGTNGKTLVVYPNKDATATSPIAVTKSAEAQLIIAENDVATGNLTGAIAIINALQSAAGQPGYNPTNLTAADVMAQVIEQRRRELFLEGHRLGDMRRYNLPLVPAPGAPFATGGVYGNQTCFPLPDVERINNPNIGSGT